MEKFEFYTLEDFLDSVKDFEMNPSHSTVATQGLGSSRELDSLPSETLGTLPRSEVPAGTSSSGNTEAGPSGKKGAKGRRRVGTTFIKIFIQ